MGNAVQESSQVQISREEYLTHLDNLSREWKTSHKEGLKLRLKTGQLLNGHFGNPFESRQKRGERKLEEAARKLGVAESELSRMRHFAHHFDSILDLEVKHPEAKTWSAVKDLLPGLRPGGKQTKSGGVSFKRTKRALSDLSSKLLAVEEPSESEKKDLREAFMGLVKVLEERFQILIHVGDAPEDPVPSDAAEGESSEASQPASDAKVEATVV